MPVNEIARSLISATGSSLDNPAVNYYQLEQDPLKLAEDTAQAFFGIRIQCSQCHNHPFDRWTMDDYRGFVAFFTQIGRKNGEDPRERIIFDRGQRRVTPSGRQPPGPAEVPRRRSAGYAKARIAGRYSPTGSPHLRIHTSRATSRT